MKVILYATVTPNGLIARDNFEEDFLPDSGWDAFKQDVAEIGNFIIGRHTYEIIEPEHFDTLEATRIVVSSQPLTVRPTFVNASSPEQALELLQARGHQTALVAGGSGLYSSFMSAGLVNELHLYVIPHILGRGIPIFAGNFEARLEFISNVTFGEGFISKYRVIR